MDKNTEENLKKAAKELAEKTGKVADMAKDTIASQMENENVKNATQAAANAAKEGQKKMMEHGKNFAEDLRQLKDGKDTEKNWKTSFKALLLICVVSFIALFVQEYIGFDMIFECCAIISLALLIYRAVKKKPKKNASIAFVVFLALSGVFGLMTGSGKVPDNVLDYMGTKDRAVYKTYDKSDFHDDGFGNLDNEANNHSGLPHITLYNRKVGSVALESGMNASFNAGGLSIGDNVNQVESCMAKLNADINVSTEYNAEYASGMAIYDFQYKGRNIQAIIIINSGIVERISITYSDI